MLGVIVGLIVFMIIITLHELGHFIGAKLSNIKVNEFSIGMGPSIYSKAKGETKYSIRALPLGGYVAMEGEDAESDDERSYEKSPLLARFITILAGPMMNFLTAFLILFFIYTSNGVNTTKIGGFSDSSVLKKAGAQLEDRVVKINNKKIKTFTQLSILVNEYGNESLNIDLERNNDHIKLEVKSEKTDNGYLLGISPKQEKGFLLSISSAFYWVKDYTVQTWSALKELVTGKLSINNLSGPVGVIGQVGSFMKMGFTSLMLFVAVISTSIGFFNILPIPALDGSKLVLIIIEAIIRRPVNKKIEQTITIIGFLALMALIIVVSIKDIIVLFR